MRGVPVAEALGADMLDVKPFHANRHYDVILLVKSHNGYATAIRAACDRLIYDPMDCWGKDERRDEPVKFWRERMDELLFDDILATSPSCFSIMREALACRVHLAPHHADPRVNSSWHKTDGPIIYAGGEHYLTAGMKSVKRACKAIGREFITDLEVSALKSVPGCSLMLHPRLPPFDSPLNKTGKPQVKMENAAAAGMRMLASDDPCVTSLRPECPVATTDEWLDDKRLAVRLAAVYDSPPLAKPVTLESHVERIRSIIG